MTWEHGHVSCRHLLCIQTTTVVKRRKKQQVQVHASASDLCLQIKRILKRFLVELEVGLERGNRLHCVSSNHDEPNSFERAQFCFVPTAYHSDIHVRIVYFDDSSRQEEENTKGTRQSRKRIPGVCCEIQLKIKPVR